MQQQNLIEATQQSIDHWRVMLQWVETNVTIESSRQKPDSDVMLKAIQQDWHSGSCALCRLISPSERDVVSGVPKCPGCPLVSCGKGSAWASVALAQTWYGWCRAARREMLPALEAALLKLQQQQETIIVMPVPPAGEQWHNPEGLTPEQFGEGWRPLLVSEVEARRDKTIRQYNPINKYDVEYWDRWAKPAAWVCGSSTDGGVGGSQRDMSYRTKLTVDKFRARYLRDPRLVILERINRGELTSDEFLALRKLKARFTDKTDAGCCLVGNCLDSAKFVMLLDHNIWSNNEKVTDSLRLGAVQLKALPDGFTI